MLSFRSIGRSYLRGPTVSSSFQHPLRRGLNGLIIGVPKENHALGEHRVALVPGNVTKLSKAGAKVIVEQDAGVLSGYSNEQVHCFFKKKKLSRAKSENVLYTSTQPLEPPCLLIAMIYGRQLLLRK